jgi:hypothetical protein
VAASQVLDECVPADHDARRPVRLQPHMRRSRAFNRP